MRKCKNCGYIRLGKQETELYEFVRHEHSVGVFEVANKFRLTLAAASTALKKLVDGGVLRRTRRHQPKKYRPNCWTYEADYYYGK